MKNLSGKSTEGVAGSNYVQVLENWNKNHDNEKPIKIKYVSASSPFTQRIQDLEQGKIDFLMYDNISLNQAIDDQGFQLYTAILKDKVSHKKEGKEYLLFVKTKEGKELQRVVNKGILKLQRNGKLALLQKKYFKK